MNRNDYFCVVVFKPYLFFSCFLPVILYELHVYVLFTGKKNYHIVRWVMPSWWCQTCFRYFYIIYVFW